MLCALVRHGSVKAAPPNEPVVWRSLRELVQYYGERAREAGLWTRIVDSLRQLPHGTVRLGTGCSGTDLPAKAFEAVIQHVSEQEHLELQVRHVFSCEINPAARDFLKSNGCGTRLLADMGQFRTGHCHDLLSDHWIPIDDLAVDVGLTMGLQPHDGRLKASLTVREDCLERCERHVGWRVGGPDTAWVRQGARVPGVWTLQAVACA